MKTDETPFYHTRVECPVCKTVNEFETIKLGAYTESGRDTDFRPLNRKWRNPRYQSTNPLLFFMASCSSCFYTREFNRRFREWKDDTTFRTHRQSVVRQRHLGALANDESVMRRLGAALWPEAFPLETALNKLLMGIHAEQLLDQSSHFDIARWYLRVSWLFREINEDNGGGPSARAIMRTNLMKRVRDLSRAVHTVEENLTGIRELLESHPESAASSPATAEEEKALNTESIRDLSEAVDALNAQTERFAGVLEDQDVGTVVGESTGKGERYGDYPSYSAFLKDLHSGWDGVPINESEAVLHSLEHYRQAYEEGHRLPQGNAQIQLAYMVGELARRVGETREAQQFLNAAVRSGREWIHKLRDDTAKAAMARHVVDLAVEQLHRLREDNKSVA